MKKLMVVAGSARKNGNSVYLAGVAAEAARAAGAVVELVNLSVLGALRPCASCYGCTRSRDAGCTIKDELTGVLERLRAQDALLLVSPVYWFSFSAQTKIFVERAFFSMKDPGGPHLLKGKELGLILSYGDRDPFVSGAVNVIRSFQDIAGNVEAKLAGVVYGTGGSREETARNVQLVEGARALGRTMGAVPLAFPGAPPDRGAPRLTSSAG